MKLSFSSFLISLLLHLFFGAFFLIYCFIFFEKPLYNSRKEEIYFVDTVFKAPKHNLTKSIKTQNKIDIEPEELMTSHVEVISSNSAIPAGFIYPVVESFTKPKYPVELSNKQQGSVELKLLVLKNGSVVLKEILNSTHNEFTESVKKILSTMRFKPGMIETNAVDTIIIYKFNFKFEK
jgi:TonB family protein